MLLAGGRRGFVQSPVIKQLPRQRDPYQGAVEDIKGLHYFFSFCSRVWITQASFLAEEHGEKMCEWG